MSDRRSTDNVTRPGTFFKSLRATVLIYAGVLFTVAASLVGLVLEPERQLRGLEPQETQDPVTGATIAYPPEPGYTARVGRDVYRSMGCVYCHSQQVRPEGFGADIDRGWGPRRTVARDYIYDSPHLLGTMRTGPDLANIAARQPSSDWHHLHLYNPRLVSPGSTMPAFRFMYERIVVADGESPPSDAVSLPGEDRAFIVPGREAQQLYTYLMTLDKTTPLEEASN